MSLEAASLNHRRMSAAHSGLLNRVSEEDGGCGRTPRDRRPTTGAAVPLRRRAPFGARLQSKIIQPYSQDSTRILQRPIIYSPSAQHCEASQSFRVRRQHRPTSFD